MAKKPAQKSLKKALPKKKVKTSPKVKPAKSSAFIQIDKDIWPLEKDVLFRPDRLKYVRKLIPQSGCVFCQAEAQAPSMETLCVYKTEHSMVLLNKFPYNSGHVLVLPRQHCGDILKLSDEQYSDLMMLLRRTMAALMDVYQPSGINQGLNHGAAAGAGIPEHLHFHVIPRWSGDLNFFPLIAETKVMVESLEQTYEKLSQYFNSRKGS